MKAARAFAKRLDYAAEADPLCRTDNGDDSGYPHDGRFWPDTPSDATPAVVRWCTRKSRRGFMAAAARRLMDN
jgi:hypothetical protein